LLTVFVGAVVGSVVFIPIAVVYRIRRRGVDLPQVPFGVFLAPAALLTLLKGDVAIAWYLSRLGLR